MLNKILTTLGVVCLATNIANANQPINMQAYSHPTLFGSQAHAIANTDNDVLIGGKVYKPCMAKTIEGKQNVVVARFAKQMLGNMKGQMDSRRAGFFDPKMPVLRSELAYILSDGLNLTEIKNNNYKDVATDYWAKTQIDRALTADVLI